MPRDLANLLGGIVLGSLIMLMARMPIKEQEQVRAAGNDKQLAQIICRNNNMKLDYYASTFHGSTVREGIMSYTEKATKHYDITCEEK